jgi:hypothetical protein
LACSKKKSSLVVKLIVKFEMQVDELEVGERGVEMKM